MKFFRVKIGKTKCFKRRTLYLVSSLFVLVFLLILSNLHQYTVTLTESGFSLNDLKIDKGGTVKFVTNRGKDFWPASDHHPTHEIYPEFDSKKPLGSKESWSFKFTKEGVWKYHDHLEPQFTGTIVVGELNKKLPSRNVSLESCGKLTENYQKAQCWDDLIDKTLQEKGLSASFDTVEALYSKEPDFASSCHGYVHKLGEKAYEIFSKERALNLGTKTAYCGYGFYHGYMQKALTNGASLSDVSVFCNYVARETSLTLEDACYHGIGHGAVSLDSRENFDYWQEAVNPALDICKKISPKGWESGEYGRCTSGVFMEIGSYFNQGKIPFNKTDPFEICRDSSERDKLPCYTQMNGVVSTVSGRDLAKGARFISDIADDKYASEAMRTFAAAVTNAHGDQSANTLACRTLQERLKMPCLTGIVLSILLNGTPGSVYAEAVDFCSKPYLKIGEKTTCINFVKDHANRLNDYEQLKAVLGNY